MKNLYFALFISVLLFSACEKDDVEIPNEEEVITTLIYTLTPSGGGETITLSFQDLDGDGSMAPVISTTPLKSNTSYQGSVQFLNEQESPAEDITVEVREEADEHQLFFQTTISDITIEYGDTDSSGAPIGLVTTLTTGASGSGQITITLRHEPAKTANGVAQGDLTNAGGETDIEVTFDINVE